MKIKNKENKHYFTPKIKQIAKKSFDILKNKKTFFLFSALIIGLFLGLILGGYLGTIDNPSPIVKKTLVNIGFDPNTKLIIQGIKHENIQIINNILSGWFSTPEKITIDIKFEDYQKVLYKREKSLKMGMLITEDDDFVPAKINYNNQNIDVKLRLKGDWIDHLKSDKWSYRIEVKDDKTIKGLKIFSIQHPKTRQYLNEWLFQKTTKKENIISLRYEFIDVTINGEHKGIYALEESFDKRLIENNQNREGPIVRFNENYMWLSWQQNNPLPDISLSSDIDAFQTSKIINDPIKYQQYTKAKDLLESFRLDKLKTSEVFDVEKFSKFMAISDVLGGQHGHIWHNYRFYYNPITSKLEPIAFDNNAGTKITTILAFGNNIKTFFDDPIFFEKYIDELEKVSKKTYLDNLFVELDSELQTNLNIIHKNYPYYHFSKDVFYENQKYITKMLNPIKGIQAYLDENTTNKTITLQIGNVQKMPIEILNIKYNNSIIFSPVNKTNILTGKIDSEPPNYKIIKFAIPNNITWSNNLISQLKLEYHILGHSRIRNEEIFPWSYISKDFPNNDFIRKNTNIQNITFLNIDETNKIIFVIPGTWTINNDLIIPENYTVIINENTTIDLKNNAKILSYSPIKFYGTSENPIKIHSSDSSGQGIAIFNAKEESLISSVYFTNLSAPRQDGWALSGAITFYETKVKIENSYFSNNKFGDDMLDLVKTKYQITNSLFTNTLFDAIDDDFGTGTIKDVTFINVGNDALDFSGAIVNVSDITINACGDKGISAGEYSKLNINNINIKKCNIGLASKDSSIIQAEDIHIESTNIGITAYQKKPEFGPAKIILNNLNLLNVIEELIIETNSIISIDQQIIDGIKKNVYDTLYQD